MRREVDVLKELNHPYIPKVYDFFVEGEEVYTVMDYIEGESLDKALKRGEKFSQAQVIRWACQLLDALCYLHSPIHGEPPKGYVHSDIKPANLMLTPQGDICLIDFNIALALGEENVIGCSAGYASPEHYGLDFSSRYEEEQKRQTDESIKNAYSTEDTDVTLTMLSEEDIQTLTMAGDSSNYPGAQGLSSALRSFSESGSVSSGYSGRKRLVTPDVRSDIYSVGATLYHLLNGKRPSKNAKEVERLSEKLFNPQVVRIISKAMAPNPGLRYQTAEEMKREFLNLREQDPRMRRWRKHRRIASVIFPVLFLAGGLMAFTGLKRMQLMESWLKRTEYAQTALDKGEVEEAISDSAEVLKESREQWMPQHVPGIQRILTEALGIYDVTGGYKPYKAVELPSAPHYLALSPDGRSAAALCGQSAVVFDTASAKILEELPTGPSPISEIQYLDAESFLYASEDGLTAYNIEENRKLWSGNAATSVCISEDGKTAAGHYEGETFATIYDAVTGAVKCRVDFAGRSQSIGIKDNLFALNADGSLLAVSFQDGSLGIYNLKGQGNEMLVFGADSGYKHFEGGFHGQYLAVGASGQEQSTFAVIDTVSGAEAGGFHAETAFGVQADKNGIYVQSDNILVKIDPVSGEQTPLVTMDENILRFAREEAHTLVTSEQEMYFFNEDAQMTSHYKKEYTSDLIGIAGGMAVLGSMDRPVIRIMQYEENPDAEIFSYDPDYQHEEARVSADKKTVMLFSYHQFRIYDKSGKLVNEVDIPDADQVIDQQFIRDEKESYLEVTYHDGSTAVYLASDGSILQDETGKKPAGDTKEDGGTDAAGQRESMQLDEEFLIDGLRIESPLNGTPIVYDAKTGKEIARLKEDTYLTYVTKAGDYMVAQYRAVDGENFGELLDEDCEVLAKLPYLSDVIGETLIFDDPTGSIRESEIYDIDQLMDMAQ